MSLEINFLDYEMEYIAPEGKDDSERQFGVVQYDPEEKTLLFYDPDKKEKRFTFKIKDIKLKDEYLNKSIIGFEIIKDEKTYEVKIFKGKLDTLSNRSFKILVENIQNEISENERKINKVFTDIITAEPKSYQKELLEKAKERNSIIFLETGLGKTYIGIMLIKEIFGEPLDANAKNEIDYIKKTNKKVLCLFQTVSLLLQQSKVIKHNTNLKVLRLYGNNEKSAFFNHSKFNKTLTHYDIICATPECIYRYFTFGYLNKNDLELILIDECHHCKGEHFYNKVLSHFIFDENKNNNKIKIMGLTASPCEEGVLEENQIKEKIIELCNNMNCYIECPKNILEELNKEKKDKNPNFLYVDYPNEEKYLDTIKEVKNFVFHSLIMPYLDLHFKNIFEKLTETYVDRKLIKPRVIKINPNQKYDYGEVPYIPDPNEMEERLAELTKEQKEENEKIRKNNEFNKEQRELIRQEIAQYIINFYLTLFIEDEVKLDEKFMGLYDQNKDICLIKNNIENNSGQSCYFTYFKKKGKETGKKYKFINESTIQEFINKLSQEEDNPVNWSMETRNFIKKIKEDDILKKFKTFTKTINLIIKFLDKEALIKITEDKFFNGEFLNDFKQAHINEYNLDQNNENDDDEGIKKSFMSTITNMISSFMNELKLDKKYDFISPYLTSLITFLTEEKNKNDKSILFINQRIIAEAFYNKLNKIFADKSDNKIFSKNYNAAYVLGLSSQDKICSFKEYQLKENISKFRHDPKCKILCATNVVEEGIDIPDCNNIINLNEMKTIKEYIQKTGRARKEDSKLMLFSKKEEENNNKERIKQIQLSIKVMKNMISENKFRPKLSSKHYIQNYNCFQTKEGAKVYYDYAHQIVKEFISKLYNDGYSYNRAKIDVEKTEDEKYIPFLLLPSVLECSFQKIYDSSKTKFETKEKAIEYFNKYENYYYLKALINLHHSGYLNHYLQFTKNYDHLMSFEEKFKKCEGEKNLEVKFRDKSEVSDNNESFELIGHIVNMTPGYIDLTYNEDKKRSVILLAENQLTLLNFDLFLPTSILLTMYYFGTDDSFNSDENKNIWFKNKPKIPYTKFAKANINLGEIIKIKISKEEMNLINFFYVYSLFLSTDAELYFYYCLYREKFKFGNMFQEKNLKEKLNYIFEKYDENFFDKAHTKYHLLNYKNAILNYQNHIVKFTYVVYNESSKTYSIDFKYIKKCYKAAINDLDQYYKFASKCLKEKDELNKLLRDEDYLKEETNKIAQDFEDENGHGLVGPGMMARNVMNFSKFMIMNYGEKNIKGSYECSKVKGEFSNPTYQKYYLQKYGILTNTSHDFLKCSPLNYNLKLTKYKVNLTSLGRVDKRWGQFRYIKKFPFFPGEVLHPITFMTIDQLYMYTLMPVILFKLQNSLIYFYNAKCLLNEFKLSIGTLNDIDIKLIMQCLNSKSTLEIENYERLEFLGDAILKFLSSIELFNNYPNANRDLLFSLRKEVENNQILFEKSTNKKLEELLFTSPRTIKRMCIPGFSRHENLIFDISYNRSFTKNCFKHKKLLKQKEKDLEKELGKVDENKTLLLTEEEKKKNMKELDHDNELESEIKTDKISIEVKYENNQEPSEKISKLIVDQKKIEEICEKQIKIIPSQTYRYIYTKTLADIVESLTAFTYLTSLDNYGEEKYDEAFDLTTKYLKEMDVLKKTYKEIINNITRIGVGNVKINEQCKYDEKSRDRHLELVIKNKYYEFKNKILAYQAMTHPSILAEENLKNKINYVNKSYQRLAFLGEAIVELFVSIFVYRNNPYETESNLHKMRICGINHHIISLMACDLKFHDCLLSPSGGGFKTDIRKYTDKLILERGKVDNKFKLPLEELDNEEFVIILCELFHSYIGAIFVDSHNIKTTFGVLKNIMQEYLNNNATRDTYTEHPKEIILNEFMRRRHFIKSLKENGGNRVILKYEKENNTSYRKRKMYTYQLIINGYIIYKENIIYNRPSIKKAQEKAKIIFMRVCDEIDRRMKLKMNEQNNHFNIKNILDYLEIIYEEEY